MLKIKDNVNLEILEKYGFKKREYVYVYHLASGIESEAYILIYHQEKYCNLTRLIYFNVIRVEELRVYCDEDFKGDVLFDLINDGLVEKC